jgi:cyanophycinase
MTAVAHNPDLLGIGLDEDTAVEIDSHGHVSVVGRGSVMVVDGTEVGYTDIHRVAEHAPLALFGLRIHLLSAGCHFDIASRMPLPPSATPASSEAGLNYGEGI